MLLLLAGLAWSEPVHVDLRQDEGERVLNGILGDDASFWKDSWEKSFEDKVYDLMRLKSLETGYVPMISGEGLEDFAHEVVVETVYERNVWLPRHTSGTKIVLPLGSGYDSSVGAEYRDSFYVLDLTVFYATFPQRMYKRHDPETNTTVLWFEKLKPEWVGDRWSAYEASMKNATDTMETRWLGSSIVQVDDVYGMFVVSPGKRRRSRVSFVSKLSFGDDAGWIARMGSQMPGVLRSGLKSGFQASVAIASEIQKTRSL
ncbi:MAG: hypothetical protein KC656_02740 [Myxococcales bacterium]|nr:hypothetical protein [Myxococcales bacterium]MCB9669094.1 hypothetical protein [Alphaproteobacteria bacterium]